MEYIMLCIFEELQVKAGSYLRFFGGSIGGNKRIFSRGRSYKNFKTPQKFVYIHFTPFLGIR